MDTTVMWTVFLLGCVFAATNAELSLGDLEGTLLDLLKKVDLSRLASDHGGHNPPSQGGHNPPDHGDHNPPNQGGHNPPSQGGHNPPNQGGHNPPNQGGHSPPDHGGHNPPGQGDYNLPSQGGYDIPIQGGHNPLGQGGHNPPDHTHDHDNNMNDGNNNVNDQPYMSAQPAIQKRDWINYAKEEELTSYMKATDERLTKIETQLNTVYCQESTCQNFGSCVNRLGGYECLCKPGFVGPICQFDIGSQANEELSVTNGASEGEWHEFEMCPTASFATGYRIKLEEDQGFGDDTAMNAIEVQCRNVMTGQITANISSGEGPFGDWKEWQQCSEDGHLVAFQLKVEHNQGSSDTGANGVAMACRGPGFYGDKLHMLVGPVGPWGEWGDLSKPCSDGEAICGVATRIEPSQGSGDDSALNDIKFKCCYWW